MVKKEVKAPPAKGQLTACVSRYGAWGDAVIVTPVLRALKADGYHVTMNCTERCYEILKTNPNIDAFLTQETNEVPVEDLGAHWKMLSTQFDRFINLSGSVEGRTLKTPNQPEYRAPHAERHAVCNTNYMDDTMYLSGYPERKGELPELHFTKQEENWVKKYLSEKRGFNVLVSLSGSSFHKIYPHMGDVVQAILRGIPGSTVTAVGEPGCAGILERQEGLYDLCGKIDIRKTFVLTKHVDLVISTETSTANAASAFDTPKIILLSHSSEENLTKYWKNCISLFETKVSCYPCHKLHYERKSCPLEEQTQLPLCAALLHPKHVMNAVEVFYNNFQKERAS